MRKKTHDHKKKKMGENVNTLQSIKNYKNVKMYLASMGDSLNLFL